MQHITPHFQQYIARVYATPQAPTAGLFPDDREVDSPVDENGGATGGIKIVIDWGALDIDRPAQTIQGANDTDKIVQLLKLLLDQFEKPMRDQLTELPIARFPLSTNPNQDFLNRTQNRPYSYAPIPGTEPVLYFCPHSQRSQKVERLRSLFSRLTLPDGSDFPADCVTVAIEEGA